jgi:shikimate dehydrogenase
MNKFFAVLGSPIEHSKSPLIHSAAYRVLAEDWQYGRAEVKKGQLRRFIETSDVDYQGFSVTMPLKEDAFRFATARDEVAELTNSVNTLVRDEQGNWRGFNTDVFGLIKSVQDAAPGDLTTVLIIGSGATAYSAMAAVKTLAPHARVLVFARNRSAKKDLISFGKTIGLTVASTMFLGLAAAKAQLTISTVPANSLDAYFSKLLPRTSFKPGGMLLDVAYDPWPSVPAQLWQARGLTVINGLDMLIWQAVAQIRIFKFGNPALTLPNEVAVIEAMRNSVRD